MISEPIACDIVAQAPVRNPGLLGSRLTMRLETMVAMVMLMTSKSTNSKTI